MELGLTSGKISNLPGSVMNDSGTLTLEARSEVPERRCRVSAEG
jgi:hypothetical protein